MAKNFAILYYYIKIFFLHTNRKKKWVFGHEYEKPQKIADFMTHTPYFYDIYTIISSIFVATFTFQKWAKTGQMAKTF